MTDTETRTVFLPSRTLARFGAVTFVISIFAYGIDWRIGGKLTATSLGLVALAVGLEKVVEHVR